MDEYGDDYVKCILADQGRMENERAAYEPLYRDIDRYIDPFGSGGFLATSAKRDIEDLFDVTAIEGLDRFTAAMAGLTIPRNQRWHGLDFGDKDLDKLPAVKRWCEGATDVLFAQRYKPGAGFEVQAHEDWRQKGKYGTAPLWVDQTRESRAYYKALHLSEIFIDENFFGQVDKIHRKFTLTLRQARQQFAIETLSPRLQQLADDPKKLNDEHQFLQVVRPNGEYRGGKIGPIGKPVESVYLEIDAKHVISQGGYYTMPILVSRHITGPRDKYGRSPAMKVLATVKGANAIARTILDAGNRAVNPPLLFHDDAEITSLITKPGGLNPGGVDEMGRQLVVPLETAAQLPFGMEIQNNERDVVKRSFLEELFRLLSDPSDRQTATQVMETLQKEGVLVAPFAGRYETEKSGPMIERELDIHMRAGRIPPFPPEIQEAGTKPRPKMTNPLAMMARAQEVSAFTRTVEIGIQAAGAGAPEALEVINFEAGMRDIADVLGARPSHIFSPEEVAARRQARQEKEDMAAAAQVAPQAAGAALDLAKANQISQSLGQGGGL